MLTSMLRQCARPVDTVDVCITLAICLGMPYLRYMS